MDQDPTELIIVIFVVIFGLLAYVFKVFFMECRECCGEHGSDTNTMAELTSVRTGISNVENGNSD